MAHRTAVAETVFDPTDPATWPPTLTVYQMSAVYQRTVSAIRSAVFHRTFVPAPKRNPQKKNVYIKPLSWNRTDVLRDLNIDLRRTA